MEFEYYVHDNSERSEMVEYLMDRYDISEELAWKVANERPFYEVTLTCDLDEETGRVTLKWASL